MKKIFDHQYSQDVCHDGAAILKDGVPMTPEHINSCRRAAIKKVPTPPASGDTQKFYYYKVDECPAPDSKSIRCICWHKVGTGPLPEATPASADHLIWRNEPPASAGGLDRDEIVEALILDVDLHGHNEGLYITTLLQRISRGEFDIKQGGGE